MKNIFGVLSILFCCVLSCQATEEKVFDIPQIHDTDQVFQIENFEKIGFKVLKKYDISELPNAESASFGWFKDMGGNPRDYEIRIYKNHQDAIDSLHLVEEVIGESAKLATRDITWKEGQSDRRVNRRSGVGHRGPGSAKAKYQYYITYGNVIVLCEGLNKEESRQLCLSIIEKIHPD